MSQALLQSAIPRVKSDAIEAALSQISAAFASLGSILRRPEPLRSAPQPPNYCASDNGVPLSTPNPFRTSLLMPGAPRDYAVAKAPDHRLAQPSPPVAPAATHASPSPRLDWDPEDRDLLLKSSNRPRFTESSGVRIRAFLADAENFLEMCGRPRNRWARFIISWLGANEAEKVRRSHFTADGVDYEAFKNGLITLFGRLEFEDSYRQQLRELTQTGSESVAAFAARTTDLSSLGYPNFQRRSSSTSRSSTSCLDCATSRRATTFGVNAHVVVSTGRRQFRWLRHAKSRRASNSDCLHRHCELSRKRDVCQLRTERHGVEQQLRNQDAMCTRQHWQRTTSTEAVHEYACSTRRLACRQPRQHCGAAKCALEV